MRFFLFFIYTFWSGGEGQARRPPPPWIRAGGWGRGGVEQPRTRKRESGESSKERLIPLALVFDTEMCTG